MGKTKVQISRYNKNRFMVGLVDTTDYNRWMSTLGDNYKTLAGAKRAAQRKGGGRDIIFNI